ncbi:receptor-like protein EIX1 [Malus domestica]|uniref:receptor-like protein EIX1 n=1 Tax=Malus domestica TaxID=3750 RepID=UPI0010AA5AE4|nr:receptor-like protein EIX1 [Malus domestica]
MRCIEREREALLAIKQKLVDDYNVLSSWGREEHKQDCCKWVGVHCSNRTNHVTQLNLGRERLDQAYSLQQKGDPQEIKYYLQGMMSPKLIELQHLKYLDLSEINFHGAQLPDFVGNLSNLRHLDISRASFGGRVPSQVGNLTHLQFLDLSYNAFANVENLNSWLPLLSSLTYLDLSYNNLRNVPDWLEIVNNHPKLTNLTLAKCGLSSPPIHSSTLFNMNSSKSLAHVDLSNNQFTSPSIFLWLSNYNASLVHLDLSSNSLTGLIPQVFGNMSSLVYLSLSNNHIEGGIPQSFSRLCNLQELRLSNNTLNGRLSKLVQMLMSTCPNQNSLETLRLSYNHLSGSIPNLTNFSSLKGLDLYENQLKGTIPESIGQMSNLEYMYLDMNALEGVVSESHFSNLSRLTSLYLSSNSLALSFNSNWVPPFQLDTIVLGSCKMGPYFPKGFLHFNP